MNYVVLLYCDKSIMNNSVCKWNEMEISFALLRKYVLIVIIYI